MQKTIFLILVCVAFFSCNNDDLPEKDIVQSCVDSIIPCPVIIGEEKTGCVANIIFLAEGFTEEEIPEFKILSDIAKQAILDMEPFTSSSNSLNFYRVDSPSLTSGIKTIEFTSDCNGTTGTNTASQTPWSVFSNKIGLERLLGLESSKRDTLETLYGHYATGDYAYTIIIANSTGYFASAEFPGVTEYNTISNPKVSNVIVSKYDSDKIFKFLIRHEFGHSFGNMDDEYVDSEANCALGLQPWFLPITPKLNILTYNPDNWFEGSRYSQTGYWREWNNSIMRNDFYSTEFSPIQKSIVEQRLADAIGCK
ncbi:M64 family metallopeptidase [Gillisia sp. JM1]|uniref:M64 family metallopeptidase n=1 Tax=Gillisia sp. JM1 TaxID=1283286 RepID=UPI00040BDCC3|nr:M64 family metallopeptidase [Gillisia sp. JM1]